MCQFCIFTHLIQFVSNYSNRIHVLTYNNPRLMPHYDYKAETLFFSYSLIPNYTVIYLTHFHMDVSAKPFVAIFMTELRSTFHSCTMHIFNMYTFYI